MNNWDWVIDEIRKPEILNPEYRVSKICRDADNNITIVFKTLTSVKNILDVCSLLNADIKNTPVYAEDDKIKIYFSSKK